MLGIWTPQPAPNRLLASSATAASVTGTLVETTLGSFTLPAGALATNGQLVIASLWSNNNSVGSKSFRIQFGGTYIVNVPNTTSISFSRLTTLMARGRSSQIFPPASANFPGFGVTSAAVGTATVNLDAAVTVLLTAQLGDVADTATLEGFTAWIQNP